MSKTETIELDRHTFLAGLMLGLCVKRRSGFAAEGEAFHQAFMLTIEQARSHAEYSLERGSWIRLDPVYRVVPEANQMLLEAEQDLLISLGNPSLSVAQFKIGAEQARQQLDRLAPEAAQWFIQLGEFFDAKLSTATAEPAAERSRGSQAQARP